MTRPKIVSLGEVLWDLFPEGSQFGGAPANFACHAATLGGEVTIVSAVGNDARGPKAIEILQAYGVRIDLIPILSDAPTGTVGVTLDEQGKPTFLIQEGSAWDQLPWSPGLEERIRNADAVYFGTLGQRGARSRETIRRALNTAAGEGVPRILDVNLRAPFFDDPLIRESIAHASILKLSEDELAEVCSACGIALVEPTEASLSRLRRECHLDLIVLTRGAEGALLVRPGRLIVQRGIPATVRDTVGAGDAFTAAFVIGLLRGDADEVSLRNACERAAKVCTQAGAVPDPPRADS